MNSEVSNYVCDSNTNIISLLAILYLVMGLIALLIFTMTLFHLPLFESFLCSFSFLNIILRFDKMITFSWLALQNQLNQ